MRELFIRLLDVLGSISHPAPSPMASLERSISAARRALAVAMAEETRESERRLALIAKSNDLENRAVHALRGGHDDLASEAAEAIAVMTTEINASEQAAQRFAAEVALARREVDAQRRRLVELDRGRRLARVGSALTVTMNQSETGLDSIAEAEEALARVTAENHNARMVRQEFAPPAEHLIERMSAAGFGEPIEVRASDVLVRLRAAAGASVANLIESNPQY